MATDGDEKPSGARARGGPEEVASADQRPLVVLSANNCWNLVHFRSALLAALQGAGFRLVVLAPIDVYAPELTRRGIEVRDLPIARGGMNPLADALLLVRYTRLLRALRPAAYCGFTIKPNVYGGIAAHLADVPAIANVTGLGTSFLAEGMLWGIAERLYRLAFRRAHAVFFHNRDDLGVMVAKGIVREEQGRVIPGSGIDLDLFRPEPEDGDEGRPATFLFIGRLLRDKGIYEFIDAARMLRVTVPDARFQLLGNPDPANPTSVGARELHSWVREGLVEHLGDQGDVRPFIRAATAVVLPSYREGMSRALLEGAAMGKPLVGTNVPGSRELVEEGVTGALCEPRDSRSLAAAMERLARLSADRLRELGAAARARVEAGYGEQVVVRAYLDVLGELMLAPTR